MDLPDDRQVLPIPPTALYRHIYNSLCQDPIRFFYHEGHYYPIVPNYAKLPLTEIMAYEEIHCKLSPGVLACVMHIHRDPSIENSDLSLLNKYYPLMIGVYTQTNA